MPAFALYIVDLADRKKKRDWMEEAKRRKRVAKWTGEPMKLNRKFGTRRRALCR
jgi:hypothetical protein